MLVSTRETLFVMRKTLPRTRVTLLLMGERLSFEKKPLLVNEKPLSEDAETLLQTNGRHRVTNKRKSMNKKPRS
jgi:hypothetical protein